MDPVLAEIYGTNREVEQTDVEKLAAAQMAEELAENDELSVDGLTQEQIEQLAQSVLDGVEGAPAEEAAATETESTEEAAAPAEDDEEEVLAKVAMFDKLGRVMAHSMWQELGSIQKEAGKGEAVAKAGKAAAMKGAKGAGRVAGFVAGAAKHPVQTAKAVGKAAKGKAEEAGKSAMKFGRKHKKEMKAGAGGFAAGAAGGVAAGMMAGKKKEGSALDTLAEQRALEILQASGIDPASLTPVNQEKVAAEVDTNEVLENAVQARAWEMLAEYGVEPEAQE